MVEPKKESSDSQNEKKDKKTEDKKKPEKEIELVINIYLYTFGYKIWFCFNQTKDIGFLCFVWISDCTTDYFNHWFDCYSTKMNWKHLSFYLYINTNSVCGGT